MTTMPMRLSPAISPEAVVLLHDLEHFRWLIVLNAVWTLIDASVPLLYRFGRLAGPVATMSGATL